MIVSISRLAASLALFGYATANAISRQASVDSCPGYRASNVLKSYNGLTADLTLAGNACNVYGTDIQDLTLTVEYQSTGRLHVKIQDKANQVYQVPESVFTRPSAAQDDAGQSELVFDYVADPFSFSISRHNTGEVLFDTSTASLVFESQYLRLRTTLPESPSLYGLGEHTDPFMLNTTNYTRTIWNRDAYTIPPGTNLYGDHPVYFDHRGKNGTHAVFLLNSNGMDVKIDKTNDQHLEYNAIGGVLDFYFLAGPTPVEAAQQYSEVVGKSAMMPYWGFGFHQCRYGMRDVYEVAEVVANYSAANIPLETMWSDIDYMYLRRVFTLDPSRFPIKLMRQLVDYLHDHDQHYVVMVDPAVAYQDYKPFNDGVVQDAFLKTSNGSVYKGVVWPGVTAFPDWFAPNTQGYWNGEFASFFDPNTGIDIDALWIDMNEASNACDYPCSDPEAFAISINNPPRPPAIRLGSPRPIPGFGPDFQPQCHASVTFNVNASTFFGENILILGNASTLGNGDISNAVPLNANNYPIWSASIDVPTDDVFTYQYVRAEPDGTFVYEGVDRAVDVGGCNTTGSTQDSISSISPPHKRKARRGLIAYSGSIPKRQTGSQLGLPDRDLINPPYTINNDEGSLSNHTLDTDLIHANGLTEYDTHNLYGTMMSEASRIAMLSRRPSKRPLIITRSTFAGAGRQVGHWLGDTVADWEHYLFSIAGMLEFGALFQVPMVGSDVCGFAGVTNDLLCARWATLGAFTPFYRNHGENNAPPHEFYRYPTAETAARNAIATRYQLLDYIYTAMYVQNQTGTPLVQPMFFQYPNDSNANSLQYQYFYGPGVLVAPVTTENSTVGSVYLPDDIFYDFYTHKVVQGTGTTISLPDVPYTTIPLFYKGGNIVALRSSSANTTTELRKMNFSIIIAPGTDGSACGDLYFDDGDSLVQESFSFIQLDYQKNGQFSMSGNFGYDPGVVIESILVLGSGSSSGSSGSTAGTSSRLVTTQVSVPLTGPTTITTS